MDSLPQPDLPAKMHEVTIEERERIKKELFQEGPEVSTSQQLLANAFRALSRGDNAAQWAAASREQFLRQVFDKVLALETGALRELLNETNEKLGAYERETCSLRVQLDEQKALIELAGGQLEVSANDCIREHRRAQKAQSELTTLRTRAEKAEKELATLRLDRERLDWLEAHPQRTDLGFGDGATGIAWGVAVKTPASLRAAIDAARTNQGAYAP